MAGASWLAGIFAAVMILAGAYSASRLAISRLRGRATESDAGALHAVMGAAMAGMLVPRLNVLPDSAWAAVFGIAAGVDRLARRRAPGPSPLLPPSRSPVRHPDRCVAMPCCWRCTARGLHMGRHGDGRHGRIRGSKRQFPALATVLALMLLHRLDHRPAHPWPGRTATAWPGPGTGQPLASERSYGGASPRQRRRSRHASPPDPAGVQAGRPSLALGSPHAAAPTRSPWAHAHPHALAPAAGLAGLPRSGGGPRPPRMTGPSWAAPAAVSSGMAAPGPPAAAPRHQPWAAYCWPGRAVVLPLSPAPSRGRPEPAG